MHIRPSVLEMNRDFGVKRCGKSRTGIALAVRSTAGPHQLHRGSLAGGLGGSPPVMDQGAFVFYSETLILTK